MASTIELQTTVTWSSAYIDYEQLTIAPDDEPAISIANLILQTILGPPFKWNWNRASSLFLTSAAGQDVDLSVSNYGFLEGASCTDTNNKTVAIKEIKQELTSGTEQGRPQSLAPQIDNNDGLITFRMLPVPDAIYNVTFYYQQSPPLFTALTQTWAPIPDKFQYLYSYGFLALSMAYAKDERFPIFNQKFVAHLLGAQQGLSETERNMFLNSWMILTNEQNLQGIKMQQGRQALGT